ncbi:filamentous hemagglutinin N-terminal domain-containing protein, partial [Opitutales bacterium]|nr:filamentous hemagglutinin N-terminal domain-containing protein [Opitutales bacterium]
MNHYKSFTHKLTSLYHTRYRGSICRLVRRTGKTLKAGMMGIGLFGFVIGTPGAALAANLPTGAQVVSGDVNINQLSNDAMRIVQGSQSAIVNWQSFDIGHGALVDVVQPNVDSAMLSRVIGNNLSEIHGSLNSNGNLYLINPNGILFGESAQVNVYSLIASTLDISDSDFLTGNIHFTGDSEKSVINLGTINSESFTALIAGDVQNLGDIITPGGDAALLSGDAVIEVGEAAGGKITMDLSGLLGGSVNNSGSIDVSSSDSSGGSAVVLGEQVSVSGSIDASGATGGGEVLIGGDFQGKNTNLSNAQDTVVSGSVSADALENGDGGRVIVWADDSTRFTGQISATAGSASGDGGFVEVSGKERLSFSGSVDVSSSQGLSGSILLDPQNITIVDSGSSNDSEVSDGTVAKADGSGDWTVSDEALEALSGNVTLQATNDITVNQTVNFSQGPGSTITFEADNHITLSTNKTINTNGASVVLRADADTSGAGNIVLGGQVDTDTDAGGAITLIGQDITTQSNGALYTDNGAITITAAGNVIFGAQVQMIGSAATIDIDAGGTLTANDSISGSGAVNIDSTGAMTINDSVSTSGNGAIAIGANKSGVLTLDGDVTSNGGTIAFANDVTLAGATSIDSTASGTTPAGANITFSDKANGAQNLSVNSGTAGTTTFTGAVGDVTPLSTLTVDSSAVDFDSTVGVNGNIDIDTTTASFDNTVTTTADGSFTLTNSGTATFGASADLALANFFLQDGLGAVNSAGDITTTGDSISITGPLTLTGDVALDTTSTSAAGANITLGSTTSGAASLTANAGTAGTATFVGAVGSTPLTGLTVDAFVTNFDNTVAVAGNIDIDTNTGSFDNTVTTTSGGTVTITNASDLTIAAAANLTLDGLFNQDGSGDVALSSDITTSGDNVSFAGAITLGDAVAIDTTSGGSGTGGDVTLSSTLDGGSTFTVDAGSGGDLVVTGAVGVSAPLTSITVSESTDVTFSNALNLSGALDTTGTGTTTLTGAASAGSFDVTATTGIVASSTLTATGGGNISLASDELDFNGGTNSIIGTGTLTLKQATAAATIGIGSGAGETLDLADADIAALKDGYSSITIGDAASGNVVVDGAAFVDPINIVSGAGLTVKNAALSTTEGAINLSADGAVTINHSVDATTTVAITADVDGAGDEDITINAGDNGSSTIAGTTVTLSSGGSATDVVHTNNFDNAEGGITYDDSLATLVFNANGGIDTEGAVNTGDNAITLNANASFDTDQANNDGANNLTIGGTVTLGTSTLTLDAGTGTIALASATAADASNGKITISDADLLQLTGGDVIIDAEIDDDAGEFLDGLTAGNTIQITGAATLQSRNDAIDLTGFNIIGDADDDSLTINSNNAAITLASVGQGGGDNDIGALTVNAGDSSKPISLTADISANGNIEFTNTSELDIAAGVDITTTGSSDILANTGVTAIDFSDGAAGTNIFTSGQDITFGAALTDSGAGPATITLAPSRNLTLAGATLDGGSNPTLDINIGTSAAGTLTFGTAAVSAGSIDIDGSSDDDTVDIDQDLTALVGDLDIAGVSAINIDGSAVRTIQSAGALVLNTASADIVIDNGSSTVTIQNTSGDAAVVLSKNITAAGENALNINSTGNITVAGIDLYNATSGGALTMNVDSNDGAAGVITVNGNWEVGQIDINGGTTANSFDVTGAYTLTSKAGGIEIADGGDIDLVLSGSGVTAVITNDDATSPDPDVVLGNVDGDNNGAGNEASLTVNSTGNISIGTVDLWDSGTGGGTLTANFDTDGGEVETLTLGSLIVGGLSLSGNGDETYTSTGALATKASGSNISLSNFGTVTFQDDVTSAGGLSISDVTSVVLDTDTKGGNITLTASSGDIAINTNIGAITASDSNNGHDVIFVTSGGTGDISLFGFDGDNAANATNADLTLNAGGSSGVVSVGAISDTSTV